jgi:hypothetical protein
MCASSRVGEGVPKPTICGVDASSACGTPPKNQDSGFRIQDSGFRIQDSGFGIRESGYGIEGNFGAQCAPLLLLNPES